jgi:DNA uptake protein ComE-like DNA-binding protein
MNRNDRRIAQAAIAVALLALIAFWIVGGDDPVMLQRDGTTDTLTSPQHQTKRNYVSYAVPTRKIEQFPFDPNTADSVQLWRLGLQSWQIRNIYKYRAQGGVYRRKEDFARLYGLTIKDYRRLEPYIRISSDYQPAALLVKEEVRDTLRYPVKIKEDERVVLNTADTTQLKRVPGIGGYYAGEIVRYGRRLGGYVSVDQLDEIDDFPVDSKKYFVISHPEPVQLEINRLTLQQLKRHPYLNFYQAKAILEYRRLHGPLKSLDDLRLSKDFSAEDIARLKPYVSF